MLTIPEIDDRKFQEIIEKAKSFVPFYSPEWKVEDDKGAGVALLKIFVHMLEAVIHRLNKVPEKNFIAFLDMLDIELLPAQPANAPVTFLLAEGTTEDVIVPTRTQVSAAATDEHEELIFETEKNMLATTAAMQKVYSVSSVTGQVIDDIYDHFPSLEQGEKFSIFIDSDSNKMAHESLQEHSLYLGHEDIFNIKEPTEIQLQISPAWLWSSDKVEWQYYTEDAETEEDKWVCLEFESRTESVDAFSLEKTSEEEIKKKEINGIESRWLRCRLKDISTLDILPTIDLISVSVKPTNPIAADLFFHNDVPLDLSAEIVRTTMLPIAADLDLKEFPQKGAKCATLYLTDELEVGDLVEFDNGEETEKRIITSIPPLAEEQETIICWDDELVNDYSSDSSTIKLLTAIRAGKVDPAVKVESTEPFQVGWTVHLIHDTETEETTIKSINKTNKEITLATSGLDKSYVENDVLLARGLYNFGKEPRLFDTFYIASQEGFSKKDATVKIELSLVHVDTCPPATDPRLSWEYWDGEGWRFLNISKDTTDRFLQKNGEIEFICPDNIEQTEVNGQENYWIRARLVGGGYGVTEYEEKTTGTWTPKPMYKLPVIQSLKIDYEPEPESLQQCLTYNNLGFKDCIKKSQEAENCFNPFKRLEDSQPALYLGFDQPLLKGPINIFFSLEEWEAKEPGPKINWAYWDGNQWTSLDAEDETENLTKSGAVALIGSSAFSKTKKFGEELYWLRAELSEGKPENVPQFNGIYLNTTWAAQAKTIKDETLGSSDGLAKQEYSFTQFPVISEEIWVQEIELIAAEERKDIIEEIGEDAIDEVKDETGKITEVWIKWRAVEDFFESKPKSRHYKINRALGKIQFGDGEKGMIPPIGKDNIKCSAYQTGGGVVGNVKALEITGLKTSVPNVDSAINYEAAGGGSDTEPLDELLDRGPQLLKHRNRAVTCEDYEWLAKQAANIVARAKCLPNINDNDKFEPGWITIIIIPDSDEDKPMPSLILRNKIERYIRENCANVVSFATHVNLIEPCYVEVAVNADVIPTSMDLAAIVENEVKKELKEFLHPLKGGPEKEGWEFGRDVYISDVYAVLEGVEGVDHVENVSLTANGEKSGDYVAIDEKCLVSNGEHQINLKFEGGVLEHVSDYSES